MILRKLRTENAEEALRTQKKAEGRKLKAEGRRQPSDFHFLAFSL